MRRKQTGQVLDSTCWKESLSSVSGLPPSASSDATNDSWRTWKDDTGLSPSWACLNFAAKGTEVPWDWVASEADFQRVTQSLTPALSSCCHWDSLPSTAWVQGGTQGQLGRKDNVVFSLCSGYYSGTVMIEATVTMLKFPPISSSGPWWLTERKYPASK